MKKELTCEQISALFEFYIEGTLTPKLTQYVNEHFKKCPVCRKQLQNLRQNLEKYRKTVLNETSNTLLEKNFVKNLSAYVDNELNSSENLKIKKATISNPSARKKLETMYNFQTLLHSAYEKTKAERKFDYSNKILRDVRNDSEYSTTYFYKLAVIFFALLGVIVGGFIYLYL
jgi:hypothetical protein